MTDFGLLSKTAVAFCSLCLIASAVYVLNDVRDRETDRVHPVKRERPLAAGSVTVPAALLLALFLAMGGLAVAWGMGKQVLALVGIYFVLSVGYSMGLKHVPILDIFIVSLGYVIRIFVGGVVDDIPISVWIVIMTFLLALFIALGKRRDDVLIFNDSGVKTRKAVHGYTLPFIDSAMMVMAAVNVVSYIMYTVSPVVTGKFHTDKLYVTALFVLLGILRYLQLIHVENQGGAPTRILYKDHFIQLTLASWIVAFIVIIYWR